MSKKAEIIEHPKLDKMRTSFLDKVLDLFDFPDEESKNEFKQKTIPILLECRRISEDFNFNDMPTLEAPDDEEIKRWINQKLCIYINKISLDICSKILFWSYMVHLKESELKNR